MLKRLAVGVGFLLVSVVAVGYGLYLSNRAPVVAQIASADATTAGKPYVVKLHAQWCVYCLATKDEWQQIEKAYAGRVNLVVLDFTNEAKTNASRAEAARLGLKEFYDEYEGATGMIVVLDSRTRRVRAEIIGSRDFDAYRAAIDAALTDAAARVERDGSMTSSRWR